MKATSTEQHVEGPETMKLEQSCWLIRCF